MAQPKLRIWIVSDAAYWQRGDFYTKYYQDHLRENLGMDSEWRLIPWNSIWKELIEAFKAGKPPDVFESGTTWVATLANMGFLTEVPQGLEKEECLTSWIDKVVSFQGRRMAVPWYLDLAILTARMDVLNSVGASGEDLKDWFSFKQVCSDIARKYSDSEDKKIMPLGFSFRPEPSILHNVIPWLWSGGWKFPDLKKNPVSLLSDNSAQVGLAYIIELWQKSLMPREVASTNPYLIQEDFFRKGSFAFFISHWSPGLIRLFQTEIKDYNIAFPIQAMAFPAGPKGSIPWAGGSVLCVSSVSKNKEIAWELVSHLISDEFMAKKMSITGSLPAHQGAFWNSKVPQIETVLDMVQKSHSYPVHPLWFSIENTLTFGLSEFFWSIFEKGVFDEKSARILEKTDRLVNDLIDFDWGKL